MRLGYSRLTKVGVWSILSLSVVGDSRVCVRKGGLFWGFGKVMPLLRRGRSKLETGTEVGILGIELT